MTAQGNLIAAQEERQLFRVVEALFYIGGARLFTVVVAQLIALANHT
jgi:hypothetical protein